MRKTRTATRGALPFCALMSAAGMLGMLGLWPAAATTVPATVHPNWSKIDLRPAGFQPQVSGLAFQSDGKLVIAHWNGARAQNDHVNQVAPRTFNGRIYVLAGVTGNSPAVTVDTIATGLEDLMGLALVNDTIYVSGGNTIVRLVRAGGLSGPVTRRDTVFILPGTPVNGDSLKPNRGRQEYLNGLLHAAGKFYVAPSSLDPSTNPGTDQINPYRGMLLEVTPGDGAGNKRGSFRIVARGLRAPSGIGFGPEGRVCVSDNQGEWLPGNKFNCLQEGRFYGARKSGGAGGYYAPWDTLTETPPTAWVVQNEIGNSPTAPLYVPSGPYAGQMLMGDVRWGTGINRYFVEKNAQGDMQAVVFPFTGGLEAGVFRMAWGPDSMLYAGMIGGRDDADGFPKNLGARQDYGLQKLALRADTAFEMLAVRARPAGLEIEFTRPVDSSAAKVAANYTIQSYHMTPSSGYGAGSMLDPSTLAPHEIRVAADRRKVYLGLIGLVPSTPIHQRVIYLRLNNFKSATGANPWATEAWYTLNGAGTGSPLDAPVALAAPGAPGSADRTLRLTVRPGLLLVRAPFPGDYAIRVLDARGTVLRRAPARGADENALSLDGIGARFVIVEAHGNGRSLRRALALP